MKPQKIVHTDGNGLWAVIRDHRSNANVFDRLKYMDPSEARRENHFLVLDGATIIAAASLEKAPGVGDFVWIKHVSVDPDHRNRGHATRMIRAVFDHAAQHKMTLQPSSFSEEGRAWLAPVMKRLQGDYPGLRIRYP